MTDIMAGLSIGLGIGWLGLALMVGAHLRYNFRLDPEQERAALRRLLFIAIFAGIERITIGLLSTPSNLQNIASLGPAFYIIPMAMRLLLGLAVWETVRWVWFVFWPTIKQPGSSD
jgi:cellulose synthase/poly-beta-1,6-N-acetylglucosamine synthase-like glycosyltransferase